MSSNLNWETSANVQPAGVRFNLSLTTPRDGDQAQLGILVSCWQGSSGPGVTGIAMMAEANRFSKLILRSEG